MERFTSFTALSLTDDMSNDFVWFSDTLLDPENIFGVELDESIYCEKQFIDAIRKLKKGERLSSDSYPEQVFLGKKEKFKGDLSFYRLGGAWAVNSSFFDILQDFDLGQSALYPVDLLKSDRKTPVDIPMYFFNLCEHKTAFAPERSTGLRKVYENRDIWKPRRIIPPDGLAVTPDALVGPDVWLDPRLRRGFFLSDRLVKALKAAKLDKPLILHRCRVLLPN